LAKKKPKWDSELFGNILPQNFVYSKFQCRSPKS
jgi:hypothetical protein